MTIVIKRSFFYVSILTWAQKFMGEIQTSMSTFWPVLLCNQPNYLSHTDLSPSLQNHKPHNTDVMVSINCLETIFEIWKCDLTKTKSSIQQLHQNAAFVIIFLVFHWLYFNKLGINLTQLESQEFSAAWRYRISKLMNGLFFLGYF